MSKVKKAPKPEEVKTTIKEVSDHRVAVLTSTGNWFLLRLFWNRLFKFLSY